MDCVVYARVSTKEQQEEGYSIPAQLKAIREFCVKEGLLAAVEFIEAESAGKAGRRQFGAMLEYLKAHPEVKVVVAHKLDRLYRNYADQIRLEEELGVRARYVVGDFPDSPQGELLRDVQLGVAKYYLGNLREEVRKGMDEKAAQGGWPHRAPVGYMNDKNTRSLVLDEEAAPLLRYAFTRYASGMVSLKDLANELYSMGLRLRSGRKGYASSLHRVLQNPMYCGLIRYKGKTYRGKHEPIVGEELFDKVQGLFAGAKGKNKAKRHVFALRGFLHCADCGCKITAETHKGHTYYRCTHGKGRECCAERKYTREELLMQQVESILSHIEIGPDIVEALVADAKLLDEQGQEQYQRERAAIDRSLEKNREKGSKLLDGFLEGAVDTDSYRMKAEELAEERRAFERRLEKLSADRFRTSAQVEALSKTAAGARLSFKGTSDDGKREVLGTVLSNLALKDSQIVDYQLKWPFDYLEMDEKGALIHEWWAIVDLNH